MFGGVELFILGLLVHSCCKPPKEEDRRGEGSWGSDQALWKPSGVVVQVTGLATVPRESCGGNLVFWQLSGVGVHVAGLVVTVGS